MISPKTALSVVLIAVAILFSMLYAQEPTSRDRPERFLMLLRTGDRIDWSANAIGYRLTIYSEDQYQERLKTRESQAAELRSLDEKLKASNLGEIQRGSPEAKRRNEDIERKDWLSMIARTGPRYGQVTHIGSDYIAVLPLNEEDEAFLPAWSIVSIVKARNASK